MPIRVRRPVDTRSPCRRSGVVILVLLGLVGCGDLLKVTNPQSLEEGQLDDPALESFVLNGAIGEFQYAYANYALWAGVLADEAFTDHSGSLAFRDMSLHQFDDLNGANAEAYESLQRARQSADDAADRLKKMLGARAAASLNVARALIYGGYSYVLLGEGFCEAPVNLSKALPSAELLTRGIARFDEGIAVATAASATNAVAAGDLINLARVGAARASLKKGDLAGAREYADSVPNNFERWSYYSANSPRENNPLQVPVRFIQPYLGMGAAFQSRGDARVPQPLVARTSLNAHPIFPPLKPSMYSGWSVSGASQSIDVATSIRFASGLEARYIVVEADGPTTAMLAFVNARRAVVGQEPLALTGSALVAEFRTQRALDFYLTGQRLGDLRRYAEAGTDLFPKGKYPTSPELYGAMHCFIVPQSEKARNPNY
jgi:starch-binding outer membrane protein, SusD/RagB family